MTDPPAESRRIALGVGSAMLAGLAWGSVFVLPLVLPEYPAPMLSAGRYLAFGLIALLIAYPDRSGLRRLSKADWFEAARLSLVGNLLYYGCLAAAIRMAGAPLPTMLIGTLPVVIAVVSNLSERSLSWRRLTPPLLVIGAGIALVNHDELRRLAPGTDRIDYLAGAALALAAVACWTWYPIRNARWLQANPQHDPGRWATAQGLATLPLALVAWALIGLWQFRPGAASAMTYDFPLGPTPLGFVLSMLAIGLIASWLGTLLWNTASRNLPTAVSGQLIVFETLAALLYAYLWRGEFPTLVTLLGIALLVTGVALGVNACRSPPGKASGA